MTTVNQAKPAHLPLGGSTGSAFDDDASSESLGSSIPEFITLTVVLPDGTEKTTEVNSGKPMIDLAVQLTAANHLSPTNHTLALYHPENGRPIEYKASQMIGSFHVDTVYVVNKKAAKGKAKLQAKPSNTTPPFEVTNRLAVNLPKNQKMVLRIKTQSTLADIFKMVCTERNLDPYKHELRHPTQPNLALNMANSLASYRINEITVVSVSDLESDVITHSSAKAQSIYDTHWTYTNSMPRKKADAQPPPSSGEQTQPSYMPGMMEKKKKKGFLSIFSRKKEGKFNLCEATYNMESTSAPPPTYEPPVMSNGNKPHADIQLRPHSQVMSSTSSMRTSVPSARTSTISLDGTTGLKKLSRKNRPAPAPPTNKPLSVDTNAAGQSQAVHSRGSSHSSGFDEINVSPLESPGSVSGKMPNSVQAKASMTAVASEDSSHSVSNGQAVDHVTCQLNTEEDGAVCSSAASTMSRTSSMSTGGDGSMSSLPRNRKKRRAPPPPQGPPKSAYSDGSLKHVSSGGSPTSSSSQSPEHLAKTAARSTSQVEDSETFDTRELQMAIAEELKKGDTEIELPSGVSHQPPDGRTIHGVPALRPCHFSPPPPPNSPPPPESPIYNPSYPGLLQRSKVGLVVADTSTQVHVTLRDSLSSEVSCDSYTSDSLPSSPRIQVTGEEERHITLERQKSDVAVFVKQMTELTEGVRQDDVIVVANDETEAVDTTVDVVQHNVLEQKESLKNRTEDQIVTEIIADKQYSEDPSSLDQVVGIQESGNIVPMSPHQEWCQGLLANDVMAADHGMSDEGIERGTFEAVFPAETQIVTGTTSSAFVNGDAEEAASTEAIINPPDISLSSDTEYKAVYVGSTARKSNIESDIPIPPEKVPEESAVTILERTLNIPDRDGTPVMHSHSESSPEGSLSNFNIDEVLSESDTGDDILPDSSQPVQLVKKKILPEFTLNLEDEDDNDEEDDNRIDNSYEYTEVITGEITTVIKLEDYQAGLSSGGMMNQDVPSLSLAANENDQGVSRTETNLAPCESMLADRVTKIAVNSEQFGEGAWTGSSFSESESRTQIADVGLSDEINFDATDVTYVSPMTVHSDFQGEFSNWSPLESNMNLADSRECQPLAGHLDYCNQEQPSYSSDVQNDAGNPTECSENTVENNESMSPPGRMSLLSIVSEVKSKSDVKQHITPLEFVQDSEVADKVSHDAVDATSVQSTTPVFKSLRDAYKNKSEQEGQVLIIPKPEPFVLPPEASISKASTHGITSTTTAVVQDSKIPSGEGKLKQGDFNVQPLVYKKESLAVSRRAPRISALDLDEKKSSGEESSQRFWGPRPWSARENSDDVPSVDMKEVLMRSREAITRSRDLPLTSEIIEIVEKSTPQLPSNESVVGMYSPGKSTAQSGSPKDKCSDISFSPHSEEEESQAMMEEKSITMLAYPVERKSFPRQSSEPIRVIDGKQYNSSTTLDDTDVSYNTHKGGQESRLYNSTLGISELSSEEGAIVEPKPVSLVRPLSVEGLGESKEKAKKSLQQQYADLQQQFTKWQKQLMDNQRLLPTNQRNEQGGVSSLSNLTTEQQIARLKAEQNYMRLSTPRPFTHRTTDPQGFKPRPIIKKTADFEKQFVLPTAHTNYLDSTDTTFRTSTDDASLTPSIPPPPPIRNPPKVESGGDSRYGVATGLVGSARLTSPSSSRSRFEPKLDPREELMIAIRNAGGRKMLTKSRSMDND